MKNEEQFVMVRFPITTEQARAFAHGHGAEMGDAATRRAVYAIGTPIPPCADVESIAWMAKASKETPTALREVVGHIPYNRGNHDDLVFRTDMEAQVAKVAAEKDAEIVRYRKALTDLSENITCGCMPCMGDCWDTDSLRDEISERAEIARTALKEGSGA